MADMNLFQKLVEIRKEVKSFNKDTKGFGYTYVSGSQAISKIREKMDELNVLLVPDVEKTTTETYDYKNGKGEEKTDFIVKGTMTYTWIDGDNPQDTLKVQWKMFGAQDDISKAFGSGLTYSERYFILKFFQSPTDADDPDSRDTAGRRGYTSNKGLSEAQINRLYTIARLKGYNKEKVDAQVKQVFKKSVSDLSRAEYDRVCKGYEK